MSARALQELVVFAHFGCGFVDAVLAGPELTDVERRSFRAIDPRAFRTDAERQHRLVGAVVDELPVTVGIAGLAAVYALFHDVEGFGAVVRRRQAAAVVFADRLIALAGDAARLEGAVARARRRRPRGYGIVRAAGVEVVDVDVAALPAWQQARGTADVVARVAGGLRLPALPTTGSSGAVLVEPVGAGFGLAPCSAGLAAVLRALEVAVDDAAAIAIARRHGCDDDDEARELLNELVTDGLLARVG